MRNAEASTREADLIAELLRNTTIQMLLLALLAGACLGSALVGAGTNVALRSRGITQAWIGWTSGAAATAGMALVASVIYIGTATIYVSNFTQ